MLDAESPRLRSERIIRVKLKLDPFRRLEPLGQREVVFLGLLRQGQPAAVLAGLEAREFLVVSLGVGFGLDRFGKISRPLPLTRRCRR